MQLDCLMDIKHRLFPKKKKSFIIFLSHHVNCKFFYIMIIYEKYWCWCQVVSAVFVQHTISVVQIGSQHCLVFWTEVFIICQKNEWCDTIYSSLKILFIVTLNMFCSVNIIGDIFMNVKKQKLLENYFRICVIVTCCLCCGGCSTMVLSIIH